MLGATSTMWDTLGWGGETQALIYNPDRKGHRHQRPGRGADRRNAGVLPRTGHGLSAGVRPPGGGHAGHARRPDGDAGRVRAPEPGRGAGAVHEMAEGYPIEAVQADNIERRRDVIASGPTRRACSCRTSTRRTRAARRALPRRDLPAAGPARHAAEARRSRSRGPRRGPVAQGGDLRRLRALLPRRYRARRSCAPTREHGGLFTTEDLADWQVHIEEPVSTATASTSTSSPPGSRARRCCRP
jgi:gamma-glutamyltranspeptidase/glutathione hydrolase